MDAVNYGTDRWQIIYGGYDSIEKKAVDRVYGLVSQYIRYILTVKCHTDVDSKNLADYNQIIIGTPDSNKYISELNSKGIIKIPENSEGYCIYVTQNAYNSEKQMIVIAGYDLNGILYGCMDFENVYISTKFYTDAQPEYFINPFEGKLPQFEYSSSPSFKNRGLWTWGHTIYDYKKYFDNMAVLKMNTVTIWNDFAPINAKDIVEYAHSSGIKVIWGYSWGWGESFNIADADELEYWIKNAVDVYEKQYAHLGGDGIYFQSFTETTSDNIDGINIAEAVVKWVNAIGKEMLKKYPTLEIQFGLHATSVKNHLEYIKEIDPRISIIWEDCGSFPYNYIPQKIEDFDKTNDLCEKLCNLRGENERFGSVLKGLICLDWSSFEHQKGNFILGCNKGCNEQRKKTIDKIWKYVQAYWIRNADKAYEMIKTIQKTTNGNATITALVEDGLFEEKLMYPVALMAAMLWNTEADVSDILSNTALMSEAMFI